MDCDAQNKITLQRDIRIKSLEGDFFHRITYLLPRSYIFYLNQMMQYGENCQSGRGMYPKFGTQVAPMSGDSVYRQT